MSDAGIPIAWIEQQVLSRLPANPTAEQFEAIFEGLKNKVDVTLARAPTVSSSDVFIASAVVQ